MDEDTEVLQALERIRHNYKHRCKALLRQVERLVVGSMCPREVAYLELVHTQTDLIRHLDEFEEHIPVGEDGEEIFPAQDEPGFNFITDKAVKLVKDFEGLMNEIRIAFVKFRD